MAEKINKIPEGAEDWHPVEDIDEARAGAYAEKPFQDAIVEYKEKLGEKFGEESVKALEWLASEEAEKAMAAYREGQEAEDPRVRILREKVEQSVWLTESLSPKEVDEIVAEQLKAVGIIEADKIITSSLEVKEKMRQLKIIGIALNSGVRSSFTNEWPDKVVQKYCEKFGRASWTVPETIVLLKGRMVTDMARGKGKRGIATLESIADLEERPVNKVVAENLGVILNTRKQIQEVFTSKADAGIKTDWIDEGMENLGWLWDKTNEIYVNPKTRNK